MTDALLKGVRTYMISLITTVLSLLWLTTLQTFLFLLFLSTLLKLPVFSFSLLSKVTNVSVGIMVISKSKVTLDNIVTSLPWLLCLEESARIVSFCRCFLSY